MVLIVFTGIIFFGMGLHEIFIGTPANTTHTPNDPLEVNVSSPDSAVQGELIAVSVSIENTADETIDVIRMRIPPSDVFAGKERNAGGLLPGTTGEYILELAVKEDAPTGVGEGYVQVSTLDYTTKEYFSMIITPSQPTNNSSTDM